MSSINVIKPPDNLDDETKRYLNDMFTSIDIALGNNQIMSSQTIVPSKPLAGKIYYFSSAVLPDIATSGYWGYNAGWVKLG